MDRLVVITGASSGIGYAAAKLFRDRNLRVLNLSRRPCDVDGVANISADFSVPGWLDAASARLDELVDKEFRMTLIHNAAVLNNDRLGELSISTFQRALEVNVTAPLRLNEYLLPRMAEGSSILYVGSTLSEKAVAGAHSYITTKHAVVGMMRATCQDLAGRSIHTACVCPGFTDTEMLRDHLPDAGLRHEIGAGNAFGRLIQPDEIAAALVFCADNPVINGTVLHANLGQIER